MRKLVKSIICLWVGFLLGFGTLPSVVQAAAGRGAGVPVETLPKELKGLEIDDHFVPSASKKVGVVHALNGHLVVIHGKTNKAYFGKEGDLIYEKDSLTTLDKSRCRIKFLDENVITMASRTQISVERIFDQRKKGRKSSFFSMLKGKAIFYALRLFSYRETKFRLATPTATIGVRGTKFGAHVYRAEEVKASRVGVRVADRGAGIGNYLAQVETGGPGRILTDIFSEDGLLNVNGKPVGPGQMYRGGTGTVVPTPPQYIRSFESETEVKSEKEGVGEGEGEGDRTEGEESEGGEDTGDGEKASEEESAEEVVAVVDTGGQSDPAALAEMTESLAQTTQQEVATQTESTASSTATSEPAIARGKTAGEESMIAALIADNTFGKAWSSNSPSIKEPSYVGEDNHLTGGIESLVAYEAAHQNNSNYKMVLDEQSNLNEDVQVSYFTWDHSSNQALGTPHTFNWNVGGSYVDGDSREYLLWGWWEDPAGVDKGLVGDDGSNKFYAASGNIWQVEGHRTHTDYVSYLQERGENYTYTGQAKGVFASSAAASLVYNLTGSFSCDIAFGSKQVSNFSIQVNAGGGPPGVYLSGGSGTLASDGGFDISGFTGTIAGNNIVSPDTEAKGSLFGGKAEGVGGLWGAHDGADNWAIGEFHGKR